MDVVFSDVLRDLNNFQSKIASLFEDFMKEKGYYNKNLEHLCKNLKESSNEVEKLKKEIEVLKEDNLNMKNIIYKGVSLFKSLDFSKTSKQHANELEALKTVFLEYSKKTENSDLNDNIPNKEEKRDISIKRYELTEEDIQKEIKLLKSVNFWSNPAEWSKNLDDDVSKKNKKEDCALQSSCIEKGCAAPKKNERNDENKKMTKESALVPRTKSFDLDYINNTLDTEFDKSVEMLTENNKKSPVFKDSSCRRHYENGIWESRGLRIGNEKFLEKSSYLNKSYPERSCKVNNRSLSPGSPVQKLNKSIKLNTFKIPPNGMLKKSHSREVEKTSSGMKIMNQTFLNLERFKRTTPEEIKSQNEENENGGKLNANDTQITSDEEIEETFIEIPNKASRVLKDIRNKKTSRSDLEEIPFMTPPLMTEPDLDETYVSASIIHKHMVERENGDRTPLKRHALELPGNDFLYKDKPVRKKAERMKLPGHSCAECNKYYENALGDIGTQDLKKILNKCSRHRERYSPSLDDTPPDFWKPYLTSTSTISPNT